MKATRTMSMTLLFAAALAVVWASHGWGQEKKTPASCPGAGYQAEKCGCPEGEKCEGCPCGECSADEKCEYIAALKEGAGTIKGVVKNKWAKRFPMVVYLDRLEGKTYQPPAVKPTVDQKNLTFTPRVLPVLVGTTVEFKNNDTVTHNVFSPSGEKYDLGNWDQGKSAGYTFEKPGTYVQLCKLHAEMVAYVVVVETPYFATTSTEDQSFEIKNVPAGDYKLKVWGERLKKKQLAFSMDVEVVEGETTEAAPKP